MKNESPLDPFAISFSKPQWWWMPIDLWLDGKLFSFKASGVLNEPMEEFIVSARNIICCEESISVVNMWREPEWHSLVFTPSANNELVYISLFWNQDASFESPESTFETVANAMDVSQRVIHAFEELISEIGGEAYEARSGWNQPYPREGIAEIKDILMRKS